MVITKKKYEEIKEKLEEILKNPSEYERVIIKYTIDATRDVYVYDIYVKPVDEEEFIVLEEESPIDDLRLRELIESFRWELLDLSERRAEEFILSFIGRKFPGAIIEDLEIARRSRYREIRVEIKKDDKLYELRLRYMEERIEAEEGKLYTISVYILTFKDEYVKISELT